MKRIAVAILAGPALLAMFASAAEYQAVTVTGGITLGSAATYSVGWRFVPTEPVEVTALGIYDADGGGLSGVHTVRLYDVTHTGVLATVTMPTNAPAESGGEYSAFFQPVSPVTLDAGVTYCVAKNKGPDNYRYDAAAVTGPGLSWKDGVGFAGDLPATADGFNIVRTNRSAYFGPTFKYVRTTNQTAVSISGGVSNGGGPTYSVGWRFQVDRDLEVNALGIYDRDGNGLSVTHTVRVYDVTHTGVLATAAIPPATPAEGAGGYHAHFAAVTPFTLGTGTTYLIANNRGPEDFLYDVAMTPASGILFQDGVAVAGDLPATAAGFTIVRPQPFSYFGPNFKFTAEPVALEPLSRPFARSVYQRDSNNVARVPVSGACGGGLDRIEARAVARAGYHGAGTDWTVIDASPGTSYSNHLEIAGGWYDLEVRAISNGVGVATARVERVGVGELFITAGQSNAANHGAPAQHPADDRSTALNLNALAWQPADDPQPYATGTGGSPWPDFADLLAARARVPVAVVAVAVGATQVSQWVPPGGYYPRLSLAIAALEPYGGCRAVLWHQGESDSLAGTAADTYAARLTNIIEQTRADAGTNLPWGVALASWHPSSVASNEAKVIDGQWLVISNHPSVFRGAATDTFHTRGWLSDAVHFNDDGLRDHGRQWVEAVWNSALSADRDGDGMPDLWMLTRFGHAAGEAADLSRAGDDADGDGLTNRDEYRALTDPQDATDRLGISQVAVSNGTASIAWPAVPGQTYKIETQTDLHSNDWNGVGAHVVAYSTDVQTVDAPVSAGQGAGFYRVAVP
jgi:hypothetical protein